jgi:hypothetical protein
MSRQINFYADQVDASLLNQHILQSFPELTVIKSNRGCWEEQQPVPISSADELAHYDLILLVPDWAYDSLHYESLEKLYPGEEWASNQFIVNDELCPVLQYKTCTWNASDASVSRGRIYWDYKGAISAERQKQVEDFFLWIKKETRPVDSISRIFPHTAQAARLLLDAPKQERPNPVYSRTTVQSGSRSGHAGIYRRRDEGETARKRKDIQQSLRRQYGGQKDSLILLSNGRYRVVDLKDEAGGLHLIGEMVSS